MTIDLYQLRMAKSSALRVTYSETASVSRSLLSNPRSQCDFGPMLFKIFDFE